MAFCITLAGIKSDACIAAHLSEPISNPCQDVDRKISFD